MIEPGEAATAVAVELLEKWKAERQRLDKIDRWLRWDHDDPHSPRHSTNEYRELSARAQAPWGDLIVSSVAQTLYVEGYRRPKAPEDSDGWDIWQANGMDARQVAIFRASLGYGAAYGTVLPGRTLAGESMPQMRGVSPREMVAFYEDPAWDDWPVYALRVRRQGPGFDLTLFDDTYVHQLRVSDLSDRPIYVGEPTAHGAGVAPVVRYANRLDLEGRLTGEIEPYIPLLGRIDQTVFDRLVVQRFGAWIVRTIAGMSVTESAEATGDSVDGVKLRLRVEDLLTAEDPDTRFGSLPATPLDGYIKAREADLTDLAAVSQTPAFELLGQMANLSAEALAAAKSSQTAKSDERKHTLGEAAEQHIRLACHMLGRKDAAADFTAQVRWTDTSIRSLSQAADAYSKMVEGLRLPPEILWSKIPGLTQQDIDEAKAIIEKAGGMNGLIRQIASGVDDVSELTAA